MVTKDLSDVKNWSDQMTLTMSTKDFSEDYLETKGYNDWSNS